MDSEQDSEFNLEESLLALVRCDEGQGCILGDISSSKNHLTVYSQGKKADEDISVWKEQLLSSIPIEFEDDWGNRLAPNWEIEFTGE
jgi:hypothetical protein